MRTDLKASTSIAPDMNYKMPAHLARKIEVDFGLRDRFEGIPRWAVKQIKKAEKQNEE